MGVRKAGIPTRVGITTHFDITGHEATITGHYRLDGTTDSWTAISGGFDGTIQDGSYLANVTFPTKGIYELKFESTSADAIVKKRIGTHFAKVNVVTADLSDINDAIVAAQGDITAIRAVTDILQTGELNDLTELMQGFIEQVNSEDGADAITSIRELLVDIQTGGVNVDSLVNGQQDLKAMLNGDEFLQDGTTANPLHNKGLGDVYDQMMNNLTTINGYITAAVNAAETNIVAAITTVNGIVTANKNILENATYGNAALKTAIDNLSTATSGDTTTIMNALTDGTNGLTAIKNGINAVTTELTSMDGKLDQILLDTAELKQHSHVAVVV